MQRGGACPSSSSMREGPYVSFRHGTPKYLPFPPWGGRDCASARRGSLARRHLYGKLHACPVMGCGTSVVPFCRGTVLPPLAFRLHRTRTTAGSLGRRRGDSARSGGTHRRAIVPERDPL